MYDLRFSQLPSFAVLTSSGPNIGRSRIWREAGGDKLLRKIGSHTDYTTLYPRRWQHSFTFLFVHQPLTYPPVSPYNYTFFLSSSQSSNNTFITYPNIHPYIQSYLLFTYSVDLVLKRTIPTERPKLVGEVSANFCGRGCHVAHIKSFIRK
jgi:hypothetical protein